MKVGYDMNVLIYYKKAQMVIGDKGVEWGGVEWSRTKK